MNSNTILFTRNKKGELRMEKKEFSVIIISVNNALQMLQLCSYDALFGNSLLIHKS